MSYDSTADTLKHIKRVNDLIGSVISELIIRGRIHDQSKLGDVEKNVFDEFTPKLAGSTFGSEEYNQNLKMMGNALSHHYENNRHHPQHFKNGIEDMNLIDVIEMLIDWKASSERHNDGDIYKSIEINAQRFGLSDQFKKILINTAKTL